MSHEHQDLDDILDAGLSTFFRNRSLGGESTVMGHVSRRDPVLPAMLGRLVMGEVLGRGGMAVVLRAHDQELDRDVAVKVLQEPFDNDADLVERFLAEARVSSHLQHPGIVPVYDVGRTADGRPYYTMKIVDGDTLKQLVEAKRHPLGARSRLLEVFARVCDTVAFAHARGVVHGDLKPSNVMVGSFGEVQVLDWGLARALHAGAGDVTESRTAGRVVGTPAYMTPEQARGDVGGIDCRTDVFGLGGILCEILTGAPVYLGETRSEIVLRATKGWIDDAVGRLRACQADGALVELALACLAPDPAGRPADAGIVSKRMADHLASLEERSRALEIAAAQARATAGQERRARRLTLAMAGAIVVALASAGGGYLWVQSEQQDRAAEMERLSVAAIERARVLFVAARRAPPGEMTTWREAIAAGRQAEEVARPGPAATALRAQALLGEIRAAHDSAQRDDAMRGQLEEIRVRNEEDRSPRELDVGYAKAFSDYGVAVDAVEVDVAAQALRSSSIREDLIRGLDDWGRWRGRIDGVSLAAWQKILTLANRIDEHSLRRQIRSAIAGGDHQQVRDLAESPELKTAPVSTWGMLASALVDRGDRDLAVSVYREARQLWPHDFWVHHDLAGLLQSTDREAHEEVVALSWTCVSLRPHSAHAWTDLGSRLLRTLTGGPEGHAAVRRALEVDPEYARAWAVLGCQLSAEGQWVEGFEALQKAAEFGPRDPVVMRSVALGLEFDALRPADASPAYSALVELRPETAESYRLQGLCALRLGHYEGAVRALREAEALEPDRIEPRHLVGRALVAAGRFADAVAALRAAVESDPAGAGSDLLASLADAEALMVAGGERASEAVPADPADRIVAARAALYQGRTRRAFELFTSALEEDPSLVTHRVDGGQPVAFEAACAAAAEGRGAIARAWLRVASGAWRQAWRAGEWPEVEFRSAFVEAFARPELEPYRGEDALRVLPEEERRAWVELWIEMAALRLELRLK